MYIFSWFSIFIQLAGLNPNKTSMEFQLARSYYSRPSVEELFRHMKMSTSFVVARNPIERLGEIQDLAALVKFSIYGSTCFEKPALPNLT